MDDPHNLARFVAAQEPVYGRVVSELAAGRKRSHWIWFIFPQIRGLGRSWTAQRYAIDSREEARAYEAHPILGPRLRECTQLVLSLEGRSLSDIFGYPDDLKFRSSMTLFMASVADGALFRAALEQYCDGVPDPLTLDILGDA